MLVHLENTNQFNELIKNGVVLVDFYATWCGPCRMLTPVLEEFSTKHEDVTTLKVDVDEFPEVAAQFNVRAVPTLILFKDSKLVTAASGFKPLPSLEQFVNLAK